MTPSRVDRPHPTGQTGLGPPRPARDHPIFDPDAPPRPDSAGTKLALGGIAFTAITLTGDLPSSMARYAAIGVALSLAVSVFKDFRHGLRNLLRADLFALLAYYFLTLFEFLLPQSKFDSMLDMDSAHWGIIVCLTGFVALLIGRHIPREGPPPFAAALTVEISPGWFLAGFWLCFCLGYSSMLASVDYDVMKMIDYFMAPRFSQPWSRERLGDWKALLFELNLLIQIVPTLVGVMLARWRRYGIINAALLVAALLLTLFYGFATGTRNIFAGFLVTFLIGYALAIPRDKTKSFIVLCVIGVALLGFATTAMLQFRDVGMRNYYSGRATSSAAPASESFYIDYNLFSICKLAEYFPAKHQYLGLEIPYQALIRPIPRALWPGKPEGLSMSIEDAMDQTGLTISASFAGEAYMSGGIIGVLILGLAIGAFLRFWSKFGSSKNSELGHLIYASGFVAAVISMRSLFVLTTALLPSVAAFSVGWLTARMIAKRRLEQVRRSPPARPARPSFILRPLFSLGGIQRGGRNYWSARPGFIRRFSQINADSEQNPNIQSPRNVRKSA